VSIGNCEACGRFSVRAVSDWCRRPSGHGGAVLSAQAVNSFRYCFLNFKIFDAISLPLIRDKAPFARDLYPGLVYARSREGTRCSCVCPDVEIGSEVCVGTLNFESDKEHGFQYSRGACVELRDILEDIVDRRKSSAHGELLRHIEYMGHYLPKRITPSKITFRWS